MRPRVMRPGERYDVLGEGREKAPHAQMWTCLGRFVPIKLYHVVPSSNDQFVKIYLLLNSILIYLAFFIMILI